MIVHISAVSIAGNSVSIWFVDVLTLPNVILLHKRAFLVWLLSILCNVRSSLGENSFACLLYVVKFYLGEVKVESMQSAALPPICHV